MVVLKYCPTKVMAIEFFMKRLKKLKDIICKKLLGLEEVGVHNYLT
jgi:hypothetical protein